MAEPAPAAEAAADFGAEAFSGPDVAPGQFPRLALNPSSEEGHDDARIVEEIDLGMRLPFAGSPDMNLVGEALHRFLAADDPTWGEERRIALAKRILEAWGVSGLDPADVVTMGNRFRQFIDKRWPSAILRREAPITYRMGHQTLSGRLDVVVETSEAIVIVDHKSFPGGRSQWLNQARKHAGQLRVYRDAISASLATPKPIRLALHLPISGEVLMIDGPRAFST